MRDCLQCRLPVVSHQTSALASGHHEPVAQVEPVTPEPAVMEFACFASRILGESKHFCDWSQTITKDMTYHTGSLFESDVRRIISATATNHSSTSKSDPDEA